MKNYKTVNININLIYSILLDVAINERKKNPDFTEAQIKNNLRCEIINRNFYPALNYIDEILIHSK